MKTIDVAEKKPRGHHTKPNVWDKAWELFMTRGGERLDRGVNYFVAMLNQLKLETHYSCEGHPDCFYVLFSASYEAAFKIKSAGYFCVEIEGVDRWSMRIHMKHGPREHVDALRWAAAAWERHLGPLKFEEIRL